MLCNFVTFEGMFIDLSEGEDDEES